MIRFASIQPDLPGNSPSGGIATADGTDGDADGLTGESGATDKAAPRDIEGAAEPRATTAVTTTAAEATIDV